MTDGWGISCKIALRLMPLDHTDDKSTWVQVMAWCRQATSHYLSQYWPRSMSSSGVTRPQWFNPQSTLAISTTTKQLVFYNAFTHILQGCFMGTGAIIWLPQCLWRNPVEYGHLNIKITIARNSDIWYTVVECMVVLWPDAATFENNNSSPVQCHPVWLLNTAD